MGKIYLIEWVDSYSINEGWELIKDMDNIELMKCQSIGYILKENEDMLLIAPHISDVDNKESLGSFRGGLIIPIISILKREELTIQN